jgi:hypothetical protein
MDPIEAAIPVTTTLTGDADKADGIVDCHACSDRTSRCINIKSNFLYRARKFLDREVFRRYL